MVSQEQTQELRDLIDQVRKLRGVELGVSVEPANGDYGEVGQHYELLVFNGEDNPAWEEAFADNNRFGWMVGIAHHELGNHVSVLCV